MISKLVEILSKLSAKLKIDDNPTFDSALDQLEDIFWTSKMLSGNFNDVAHGKINKKRRIKSLIVIIGFYLAHVLRSIFVYLAAVTNVMIIYDIVGGYFLALGTAGLVLQFWVLCYSLFLLIVSSVVYRAETRNCCELFTDFRNVSNVTLISRHLTFENFQKFKVKTRLCVVMLRTVQVVCYATICQFEVYGIYRTHQVNQNLFQLIYTTLWGLSYYFIWLWHGCLVVTAPLVYMYLSANYSKMRYEQISDKLTRILQNTPKFDTELIGVIAEYDDVSDQVDKHNYIVKWILFVFNYVLGMFAAVSVFAPIYVKFESQLFRYAVIGCGGQFIAINIFFARVAASIYKNASDSFQLLNSIQVRVKRMRLNQVGWKMMSLIKRVGSQSCPISFYCSDLFPYTSNSFVAFLLESCSTFFLVVGLAKDAGFVD